MQPKMFTELPSAIRESVFDLLSADDRMRLNMALPKDQKITNTSKTTIEKTRKLGVFTKALKRRPQSSLSESTKRWLSRDYASDPAAQELFQLYNIRCPTKNISAADFSEYTSEDIELHALNLVNVISQFTPSEFDKTVTKANGFWKLLINSRSFQLVQITLGAVSYENEELLTHILKRCDTVKDDISEFLLGDIRRISSCVDLLALSATKVSIVMRHLRNYIQPQHMDDLIKRSFENAYTDTLEVLMKAGLV